MGQSMIGRTSLNLPIEAKRATPCRLSDTGSARRIEKIVLLSLFYCAWGLTSTHLGFPKILVQKLSVLLYCEFCIWWLGEQ